MSIPMTRDQVLNRYFLEMRCKVLELAASLDRLDRADPVGNGRADPRVERLNQALRALIQDGPGRAERVQLIFSRDYDPNWRK
jgi:hypothetical protein